MFFWKKTVITCNNTIIWFSNKNKYILKMCLPDPLENALEYFIDISFFANFFATLLKQFLEPLDNWIETVIQKKNAVQIIFVLVLDTILFFSLHVTFTNKQFWMNCIIHMFGYKFIHKNTKAMGKKCQYDYIIYLWFLIS